MILGGFLVFAVATALVLLLSPRCIICDIPELLSETNYHPLAFIGVVFSYPSMIVADLLLWVINPEIPAAQCILLPRYLCPTR